MKLLNCIKFIQQNHFIVHYIHSGVARVSTARGGPPPPAPACYATAYSYDIDYDYKPIKLL